MSLNCLTATRSMASLSHLRGLISSPFNFQINRGTSSQWLTNTWKRGHCLSFCRSPETPISHELSCKNLKLSSTIGAVSPPVQMPTRRLCQLITTRTSPSPCSVSMCEQLFISTPSVFSSSINIFSEDVFPLPLGPHKTRIFICYFSLRAFVRRNRSRAENRRGAPCYQCLRRGTAKSPV